MLEFLKKLEACHVARRRMVVHQTTLVHIALNLLLFLELSIPLGPGLEAVNLDDS
jgi:hypothetical protein